ncbi:hypothetical protein SETIT_2G194900v2 [Setaria italica]|uniref:Uncharacterized protein n=2 Tax=Setaria TaxID=4554 RepID=A0A368Q133_SETIT|nr:hypothetical protein SETIT_2G194900v2 [Setaria italica]TKW32979.1 hypothetical protein SEVIR_2G202450v2 [Setaria viridis]
MQSDTYFRQNCSYSISSAWFVILTLSSLQFCSASSTPSCLKRTAQIICEPIYKLPLRPLPRVLHSCLLSGAPPSPTPGACCTLRGGQAMGSVGHLFLLFLLAQLLSIPSFRFTTVSYALQKPTYWNHKQKDV